MKLSMNHTDFVGWVKPTVRRLFDELRPVGCASLHPPYGFVDTGTGHRLAAMNYLPNMPAAAIAARPKEEQR